MNGGCVCPDLLPRQDFRIADIWHVAWLGKVSPGIPGRIRLQATVINASVQVDGLALELRLGLAGHPALLHGGDVVDDASVVAADTGVLHGGPGDILDLDPGEL